jgi:hypothetical protein
MAVSLYTFSQPHDCGSAKVITLLSIVLCILQIGKYSAI